MKPVLFIAFLALGPALGDQLRLAPPSYADTVDPVDPAAVRALSVGGPGTGLRAITPAAISAAHASARACGGAS